MERDTLKKVCWNGLFIANLYVVGYLWLSGSGDLLRGDTADVLVALGRLAGLLLQYFILIELILVSRLPALERLYGFDKQNVVHRRLGYGILVFLLAHPALLSFGYGLGMERGTLEQFSGFVLNWEGVAAATFGVLLMVVAGILSIPKVRSLLSYEFWYFTHLPLYLAVALAFEHQIASGDVAQGGPLAYWLAVNFAVFGVILLYRFFVPVVRNVKHRFRVVRVVRESKDVVSIYISGVRMDEFRFESGQWVRVIFLERGMWHGHPFSLSAPYNGNELRLTVKALGDWTSRAGELHKGTRVWVEGPLGTFTLAHAKTRKFLFIAGGIGVTPILAMLRSLPPETDAVLLYGVRTRKDMLFTKELSEDRARKTVFLSDEDAVGFERGRITLSNIQATCPDFLSRDVYLCGPPAMVEGLRSSLVEAGLPYQQLHFEIFG